MIERRLRHGFALDLALDDASVDPAVPPGRRMIAAASLGMGVDDAFYAARELREAIAWVHEGEPGAKARLSAILANGCEDYQRCLYFCLAGRGVVAMLDDLMWLEALLRARGAIAAEQRRRRLAAATGADPYIAKEADGPVCGLGAFAHGASWWAEQRII